MPPKKTRQDYLDVAKERGFEFLFDGEPEGSKILYEWKCSEGHIFKMRYNNISSGKQGCQECYDSRRGKTLLYGIEKYHELANKNGFKFIDKKIPDHTHHIYWWECEEGHKWKASYHNMTSSNSGCPGCYGNQRKTIEDYYYLAEEGGFEFIDDEIPEDVKTNCRWRCEKNHIWISCYSNMKKRGNCPDCSGHKPKILDDYHELAKERGYEFMDKTVPANVNDLGNWKCNNNHTWPVRYSDIKQGSGCPHCRNRSEQICRETFEEIFECKFNKIRPNFLDGLELDGYNKKLKLAFEYNGKQHEEYVPHYHRNGIQDLVKQKERDQKKYKICTENDIKLLIIPHKYHCKKPELLIDYIIKELEKLDLVLHICYQ